MHRGDGRRPDRPRQLPVQPDRAGPPPRPGGDEACAPTSARPRCRWRTTSSRRYRQAVTGIGVHARRRCRPPSATWSSRRSCSTPSARRSSAAGACSSTARPATARRPMARSIGDFMNQAGGAIYVPYAFLAEGSIITVYDPSLHQVDDDAERPASRTTRRRIKPPAQHRHRRPALGAHPPAGHRHRRRAEPGDARPAVQRRVQLLPGPAARQGQRRRLPDRRLRPPVVQPQGTAQPLDLAAGRPARLPDAWPPARSSRCRSSS